MVSQSIKEQVENILKKVDIEINSKRNKKGDIVVHNERFYSRVLGKRSLGLGESYMDGDWDCSALDVFFYKLTKAKVQDRIEKKINLAWNILKNIFLNPQSVMGSKKVADIHYNLGNDLYELMLDRNMQYTCAYFKGTKDLDKAQENKLDLVAKKLKLKKGMKVLELGSGFGGLARWLAKNYGVEVVSYNISKEQVKYGRKICEGLKVQIKEEDYRNALKNKPEGFDRVVSVGMMEHVGFKNYREMMKVINHNLKPKGLALVHTIGRSESSIKMTDPWISKYIFPGGHLPSISQITKAGEGLLVTEDVHNFGSDYDKTLMAWYKNTNKNWNKLKEKYGKMQEGKFKRMWDYYLLCCAGSFRARNIQLFQTVLSKNYEKVYEGVR